MTRRLPAAALLVALALTGCSNMQLGSQKKKVVLKDFAEGRVVQVALTDRLTGAKEMLFVSMPKKSLFLEGYIQGLVVDYVSKVGANVVVRGLRMLSDFEYEFQMALTNRKLAPGIETIFMMPHESYSYISSKLIKEAASLGADVKNFIPKKVQILLKKKLRK